MGFCNSGSCWFAGGKADLQQDWHDFLTVQIHQWFRHFKRNCHKFDLYLTKGPNHIVLSTYIIGIFIQQISVPLKRTYFLFLLWAKKQQDTKNKINFNRSCMPHQTLIRTCMPQYKMCLGIHKELPILAHFFTLITSAQRNWLFSAKLDICK